MGVTHALRGLPRMASQGLGVAWIAQPNETHASNGRPLTAAPGLRAACTAQRNGFTGAPSRRSRKQMTLHPLLGPLRLLLFNSVENFFPMHLHVLRRIDSNSNLIALHSHHRHGDILANHQRFAYLPSQNQHVQISLGPAGIRRPTSYRILARQTTVKTRRFDDRRHMLNGLMVLLLSATAAALTPNTASAQEQTPSSTAPTDTAVRKLGRMDVRHPLHVGSDYYPKQSLKNHEQGKCTLAFFINADGTVPAAQLLRSSGFPRLDAACFESVIGAPLIPATINGTRVAGWYDFNVVWVISGAQPPPPQPPLQKSSVPRVADDYELQVGDKFYPHAAGVQHPRGYCVVHTSVGSSGTALDASITHSTGSPILDKACLAAMTAARFTPELQDGRPVADSTDIAIYW
jgi:TonB family protein